MTSPPRQVRGGPTGSTRPGQRSGRTRRFSGPPQPRRTETERKRPRFTGRAAVLVLVLAVLTVSYASSMKAYLQQREQLDALRADIGERESNIAALEREKQRWADPAFVRAQARQRFGYVLPGETAYVVLDSDGDPLDPAATLADPDSVGEITEPTAWWTTAWASVGLAANPPAPARPPADRISAP